MKFEELRFVCQEAARDLVHNEPRPLLPTVVLPGPDRTRLVRLPDFPADDAGRRALLAGVAADEMLPGEVPAYGFVAEAEAGGVEVVVVVYGARRHAPEIAAAPFVGEAELGEFEPSDELDPAAMRFLHPLQQAVDSLDARPPDPGIGGLPIVDQP